MEIFLKMGVRMEFIKQIPKLGVKAFDFALSSFPNLAYQNHNREMKLVEVSTPAHQTEHLSRWPSGFTKWKNWIDPWIRISEGPFHAETNKLFRNGAKSALAF